MTNAIRTLRREFRHSAEARYVHRLHGVLLVMQGLSTVEAARLLGDSQRIVSEWTIRFRESGCAGLRDKEKSGRPATLTPAQRKALHAAFEKSPHSMGLKTDAWTGLLVSQFLRKRYGIKLTMRHCRRLLKGA